MIELDYLSRTLVTMQTILVEMQRSQHFFSQAEIEKGHRALQLGILRMRALTDELAKKVKDEEKTDGNNRT